LRERPENSVFPGRTQGVFGRPFLPVQRLIR
jgi:hypothetical protein